MSAVAPKQNSLELATHFCRQCGQNIFPPLPPEIFLDLGSAGGQEIVEIHDGVNSGVDEGKESTVTSANKPEFLLVNI